MSDPTDNPTPASKRHWMRWIAGGTVVVGLLLAVGWWAAGKRVWTDDRSIFAKAADATLRQVPWTKPQPPSELFNTDAEEYEPSVSPDGNELYFVRGKA